MPGYSRRISVSLQPSAIRPMMKSTDSRVPRTCGFPPSIAGSRTMRPESAISRLLEFAHTQLKCTASAGAAVLAVAPGRDTKWLFRSTAQAVGPLTVRLCRPRTTHRNDNPVFAAFRVEPDLPDPVEPRGVFPWRGRGRTRRANGVPVFDAWKDRFGVTKPGPLAGLYCFRPDGFVPNNLRDRRSAFSQPA